MAKFTYVVQDNEGIHARPAGMLAKEAKALEELRLQSPETEKQLTLQDYGYHGYWYQKRHGS